MFDAINTALTGLATATARLNTAATHIANFASDNNAPSNDPPLPGHSTAQLTPPTPPDDTLPSDLIALQSSQFLYSANASVIRASDHMLGTLLDVLDDANHPHHRAHGHTD